ncbi:uncharacterized protein E5676_scaffold6571G00030 [Cucumis melo var. makuwa]|uniref:Retrotransposon gag domain-containing protein n=1 Tax=Cucumis melo var. makuwa TaxID=1194695 RepID=A0A5A7TAV3_CUCMM|nr:uncharacterized protein E6C27_scaffold92G00020 [Cucumis melo var. makuwa]TYK03328.1 uncharacterized protein E5676_scaffold6571G00030 [Cucumis melo var. makuwa]
MKRCEGKIPSPNYEQTLYNQHQGCRQGGRSMAEYIEEFHRLGARTNLMENEQDLIAGFVGGLRLDIKENLLKNLLKSVQRSLVDEAHRIVFTAVHGRQQWHLSPPNH